MATVVTELDARVSSALSRLRATPAWDALTTRDAGHVEPRALMRELYREAASYHRPVFEAASTMVGRFPPSQAKVIERLYAQLSEEVTHGELALEGYARLGGDREAARRAPMSPAAFAVASVWWGLCRFASPFGYLGAMYFFEASTPQICQAVLEVFERQRDVPESSLDYIKIHAKVDVKHSQMLRDAILTVADGDEGAGAAILYGQVVFAAVYPLPIFEAALARA